MTTKKIDPRKLASFILRAGLALTFLYASIASFLDPNSWIGFFPPFLRNMLPASVLLTGFSLFELILSLWLLCGKYAKYAGVASALTLFCIMAFNITELDILFRDIAVFFSAVALVVLELQRT